MYNVSAFTNDNKANCVFNVPQGRKVNIDALEAKFAATVQHDKVNDAAFPVIVYERNNSPVAWYDIELLRGFVAR